MKKYVEQFSTAVIISLLAMALWGSAIPMIKISYEMFHIASNDYGGKILLAGLRFLGAGLLVSVYYGLFSREKIAWSKVNWKFFISLALVQVTFQYIFYYVGLGHTDGVKAAVIQSLNSVLVVTLAHFMFIDDKMNKKKTIALMMGMVAVCIANFSQGVSFRFSLTGEGFILIATTFNALGTLMVRKYGQNQNTYLISAFQFLFGSLWLIGIGLQKMEGSLYVTAQGLLLLGYGSFISATAFLLWYMVLKYQKAGNIGIFKLFVPIFGSLMSAAVLQEKFSVQLWIALALTIGASLFLHSRWLEPKRAS